MKYDSSPWFYAYADKDYLTEFFWDVIIEK